MRRTDDSISDHGQPALGVLLSANPRGLLLARDELAGWFDGFDAYRGGRGGDVAHWLEMYQGENLVVDRKTGDSPLIDVSNATVSVTGGVQPQVLARVLKRGYFENGLAARLLLAMPPRRVKRWTKADLDLGMTIRIRQVFSRLFELSFGPGPENERIPVELTLTRKGRA